MYHGDIRLGDTIDIKFTTRQISGAPSTLSSSPVISAYPGNSTTELTAGITLSVDFDARTGLNNVRVVATSGNGYATATNYTLVITTGTVNSVSVVGECIGSFSIEARSAVMPTTAARTLDVSATGEAGVDWANVGSPTTANALTGTTISTTQKVDIETIKTNPVVNGGTATFPTNATLASTTNITAGTITTATNLTTNNDKTGYGLSAAAVQAIWDALTSALTTVGSIGKLIVTNLDALISSRMATYTQPTGFLAATFPSGTIANTTNITAGTIATVTNVTTVNGLAANVITAAATAADFTTEVTAGLSTLDAAGVRTAVGLASANLDTQLTAIDDFLDTEIAAIKAKTDSLTFTTAGQVDANVQRINDITITGNGQTGTEFGV